MVINLKYYKTIKKIYILLLIAILISTSQTGCISSMKDKENIEKTQKAKPADIQSSPSPAYIPEGNSYYYFILSQIKNNQKKNEQSLLHLVKARTKDPESIFLKKSLARKYLIFKMPGKAEPIIQNLLKISPKSTDTLELYAGYLAVTNHTPQELADVYKKIITINPDDTKAPVALAFLFQRMDKIDELITLFEDVLKKTNHNYFIYFYLGEAYLLDKKYNSARTNLHRAAEIKPEKIEPKIGLIEAIKKLEKNKKNKGEIIALYDEILAISPSDIVPLMELSYFYQQYGDYEKADDTFKAIAEEWNIEKRKITALLQRYIQNKAFKRADFLSSKINQATGDDSIAIIHADLLKANRFTQKALEKYNSIKKDSINFPQAIAEKAVIYHENKKTKKAFSILNQAIKTNKNNPILLMRLGNIYEDIKNYNKAFETYQRGLQAEPAKKWFFYYKMGVVSDKSGKKNTAVEYMKKVLKLSPDNPDALNYLGYTYADMGINLEQAKTFIQKALSIKKNNGYILDSLGWVTFKLGETEKALELLKKAHSLEKNDPIILEHIGDVYKKMNKLQKARQYYQKSLEKRPQDKNIQKKVFEIESK